jgi:hypothetical protein
MYSLRILDALITLPVRSHNFFKARNQAFALANKLVSSLQKSTEKDVVETTFTLILSLIEAGDKTVLKSAKKMAKKILDGVQYSYYFKLKALNILYP